ncbi:MAG: hypothetical protein SF051_11780 [Elusimicrobiota bacterium]|nr:hypothetical protein [Elusimicrobiota bacterium]
MSWENRPGWCPSCKAAAAPDAKECLACGCVFEKWHAKQARGAMADYAAKESLAQARERPVYEASPPPPERVPLTRRLAGAATAAAAAGLLYWLYSPGSSAASAPSAAPAGRGFTLAAPAGWTVASDDPGCRDGGCVVAAYRLEGPATRINPSLTVRLLIRRPSEMAGGALAAELAQGLRGAYAEGEAAPAAGSPTVDGLPVLRVEGRGLKRRRVETVARVATNADAYLRAEQAKNPNKGVYSVMAQVDYSGRNPSAVVVLQEAQYADIEARTEDGMVLVPLRDRFLQVSYEYDEADAATARAAVDAFLAELRVSDRSRPVDRIGPAKPAVQFGAIGLVMAAVFLLLT